MGKPRRLLVFVLLIGGCGKGSTTHWIDQLRSPEVLRRIEAVHTLQERKSEAAVIVPALIDTLKDEDSHVRRDAAGALGSFGKEAQSAIPALQLALRDRDASVRRTAGIALLRIDPNRGDPFPTGGSRSK
jgi:HEAT repeat protein